MHQHQKFYYQCTTCEAEYDSGKIIYLCPVCQLHNKTGKPPKGVLKVFYQYDSIKKRMPEFKQLKEKHFLDLLPVKSTECLSRLKIGNTPLYKINKLHDKQLPFQLLLKDDSQNLTFSFKDRASAVVSTFAKERGLNTITAASTGNAGSSLAGICAAQGQKAVIFVPETAPLAKLIQIVMYGATIIPVKGTYDDAFDLSVAATVEFGWYNRNTAFNPLTIEGKKTVAFELYEQMDHKIPDRIFLPVGDGVIISGVYKGFEDLLKLGFIEKIPVIVAVQSSGSDNLIRNLNNPDFEIKPSHTVADSISVDAPRNFYMARQYIKKYRGEWLAISDEEILNAASSLARQTGIFTEPASAAAYSAFLAYQKQERIEAGSMNVVLLTGSGLKDLRALDGIIKIPDAIEPNLTSLRRLL